MTEDVKPRVKFIGKAPAALAEDPTESTLSRTYGFYGSEGCRARFVLFLPGTANGNGKNFRNEISKSAENSLSFFFLCATI